MIPERYVSRASRSKRVLKQAQEEALAVRDLGTYEENQARNAAFLDSRGCDAMDGWLWDLAWAKAKEYYAPH